MKENFVDGGHESTLDAVLRGLDKAWQAYLKEHPEADKGTKKFHLPGDHDQEDHGNWSAGEKGESKPTFERDPKMIAEVAAATGMPENRVREWLNKTNRVVERFAGPKAAEPTEFQKRGVSDKSFLGECYDRAGLYFVDHYSAGMKIVHGTIQGPRDGDRLLGHSWVDLGDGKVFDGALQKFFDKDSYYRALDAKEEVSYNYDDYMKKIREHKHWGPWHETKGAVNRSPAKKKRGRKK